MLYAGDLYLALLAFLDKGGIVLWAIFILSALLFVLIAERFLELRLASQSYLKEIRRALFANPVPYRLILLQKRADRHFYKRLALIKVLIAMLPLFGLLGTVTGMIEVFEVMAAFGNSNPRLMASGVARAIIPTMSGMALAVFALILLYLLQSMIRRYHVRAYKELNKVYNATL